MKTTLITGASSGIGRETAVEFARNGYDLILTARRKDKLEELRTEILKTCQVRVELIDMDLARPGAAHSLYDAANAFSMPVDILINNAGYGLGGVFVAADTRKQEDMLMLNMVNLTTLTHLYVKEMLTRKGGTVINLASTAAFQPIPGMACYAATKSYVLSFTEGLSYELRKTPVRVFAICPGPTRSEFAQVAGMGDSEMFSKAPTSADLARFIYQSLGTRRHYRIHGFKNRFLKSMAVMVPHRWSMGIVSGMLK